MVSKRLTLSNSLGFHMRPAGVFARAMENFSCDVWVYHRGVRANGKSIMNLIAACIKCGEEVEVRCDGPDEEAALCRAVELIEAGLGERRR